MKGIRTWEFSTGKAARDYERFILDQFKQYKYLGETPFTDGTGTTECFNCDIFKVKPKK